MTKKKLVNGEYMTKPEINVERGDTTFTYGDRKYVLAGPESYVKYTNTKTVDEPNVGGSGQDGTRTVTTTRYTSNPKEVQKGRNAFFAPGEYTSWIQRMLNSIFKNEKGGTMKYLQAYAGGGEMQQLLAQLMKLAQAAAKEIEQGQVGEASQKLLAAKEQLGESWNQIIQQVPQLEELVSAIEENTPVMEEGGAVEYLNSLKCGGKPKKIKKAEAGCPCKKMKKLMREGGKIVEVVVDCNGNIISAKKGCKVQKGEGGIPNGFDSTHDSDWLMKQKAGANPGQKTAADDQYYKINNKTYKRSALADAAGNYFWGEGVEVDPTSLSLGDNYFNDRTFADDNAFRNSQFFKADAFKTGADIPFTQQYIGKDGNLYTSTAVKMNDGNWTWNKGVLARPSELTNEDYAKGFDPATGKYATLQDAFDNGIKITADNASKYSDEKLSNYNQVNTMWGGRVKGTTGNSILGTEASKVTAADAIDQLGGYSNAMKMNNNLYRAAKAQAKADYKLATTGLYGLSKEYRTSNWEEKDQDGNVTKTLGVAGRDTVRAWRRAAREEAKAGRDNAISGARKAAIANRQYLINEHNSRISGPDNIVVPAAVPVKNPNMTTVTTSTTSTPKKDEQKTFAPAAASCGKKLKKVSKHANGGWLNKF